MKQQNKKSVYSYGASYGLYFGLYLTLISACFLASTTFIETIMLVYLLLAGVPVATFALQYRLQAEEPRFRNNASMWMFGICLFLFGSLICGALTAIYIFAFDPNFIYDYSRMMIEAIENSPLRENYTETIQTLGNVLDKHLLPSVMETMFLMIWLTTFGGSILSLILAPIVCYFRQSYANKNKNQNIIR